MSTTIRIDEADKDRLRDIQQRWRRSLGQHATHQELLSKAFAYLLRHWDDFVRESTWRPLAPHEIKTLEKELFADLGPSLSQHVDEILYGTKQ